MNDSIMKLKKEINECQKCDLYKGRNIAIDGDGVINSSIMLIGEAPGADEDEQGKPFVGRSGRLLMQMLAEIGISREKNLYITNVVKCRPPENRNPKKNEINECRHYLDLQINLHNPQVIIMVGNFAIKYFLGKTAGVSKIHGEIIEYNGRILFPVYHPAAILRNARLKPVAYEDFKKLQDYLMKNNLY